MDAILISDRYRLLRELGRGRMGVVWLAYDRVRQEEVAIKRVLVPSSTALLRLKREFRVIAPLRHRNLVRVYDLWSDSNGTFFTMDFIDGDDLRRILRESTPSLGSVERTQFALDVARQTLVALTFLHERGIMHRDIKPANLMLAVDGTVKLIDFGVLAACGDLHVASLDRPGAGTPPYRAPEQTRGGMASPKSDMYSLGVLLFYMTVGREPASKVAAGSGWDEMPADVAALCRALLQNDPRLRPDAATALKQLDASVIVPLAPIRPTPSLAASLAASPEGGDVRAQVADWRERVCDGTFEIAVVEGPTRCGKTSALRWLQSFAHDLGGLVLIGRGRREEHVEFNVLDAAIDGLATALLETPMDAELASDLTLASETFPVLAGKRLSTVASDRHRAFDAVIRILESLAGLSGLYLLIDDLHLADAESLAFLTRLSECRPAGVGVLATLKRGAEKPALRQWLDARPELSRYSLATPAGSAPRRRSPVRHAAEAGDGRRRTKFAG